MNIQFPKIALAIGLSWTVTSLAVQAQDTQPSKQIDRLRAIALLQLPDGLHKAALASGGIFETSAAGPPIDIAGGLADLVSGSQLIVAARILSSESILAEEGRDIDTVHTMQVTRTFKGGNPGPISLAVPGGAYTFPDGSKAIEEDTLCKPLVKGAEYILFLTPGTDRPTLHLYYPASRCQAIFEVGRDGHHLYSHTYFKEDPLRTEARVGKEAFIRQLQKIVASQHPEAK
ncbi:MAG TPA: hypothetical protein VGU23_01990 [Acidobacteriaceae bacterium]|nr:hypothetical protein [Acidobacteriaceae bacterium]